MQRNTKKYFVDGLIQFTIILSLIGVRVDLDSYLNGHFNSPLIEIDGGPSSAFIQTPFHHYHDTAAGQLLHPKCPELEDYFTNRLLLNEVRALGSPTRFPTRISAWLMQLVPNRAEPEHQQLDSVTANEEEPTDGSREGQADATLSNAEAVLNQSEEEVVKDEEEEISLDSSHQPSRSSTVEQEVLFSSSTLPPPISGLDLQPRWSDFLANFDDFDSLVSQHMPDLEADLPNPIDYNASLQDAMVGSSGGYRPDPPTSGALTTSLFSLESTNFSSPETPTGTVGSIPLFSLGNSSQDGSHSRVGGFLDEAVFDQINLLGLEGLTNVDSPLLNQLEGCMDSSWVEDLDSDSGLSLECSSRSPASVSTSSSDSSCEDEGGATGYSSEVDSLSNTGGACASACYNLTPENLYENLWHDHTYSAQPPEDHTHSWTHHHKGIKQELMSEDETGPEEPSRDERRLQALGLPFTAPEIVNMPVEDFLELLEGQGLSLSEVTLLRDVRRRGKNKLAAQNCRKRKLHAILGLQKEVEGLAAQRDALLRERARIAKTLSATAECYEALSYDLLRQLRDENGQPLSSEQYTLHCSANGRVVIRLRASPARMTTTGGKTAKRKKEKKP